MRKTILLAAVGGAAAVVAVASIVAFAFAGVGERDSDQGTIDQGQVKISTGQAQAAATTAAPGAVEETQLGTEGGIAAYTITIKRPDGSLATVDVNASNGQVVRQEDGAQDGEDAGDGG